VSHIIGGPRFRRRATRPQGARRGAVKADRVCRERPLERMFEGSLRFACREGVSSHEKLYPSKPSGSRLFIGSANLAAASLRVGSTKSSSSSPASPSGARVRRLRSVRLEGQRACRTGALIATGADGTRGAGLAVAARRCADRVCVLSAGGALIDQPSRPAPARFAGPAGCANLAFPIPDMLV
jgi:hypothetical protein